MSTIRDILDQKGRTVFTIAPTATIQEAIQALTAHKVGALIVVEGDQPAGILSERDIVRAAAKQWIDLEKKTVATIMSRDLIIGVQNDSVGYVMSIMTQNRIRHLPVLDGKKLVGMISIGDIVRAEMSDAKYENRLLHDYIEGKYPG